MLEKSILNALEKQIQDYRIGLLKRMEQFPKQQVVGTKGEIVASDLGINLPLMEVKQSMRDQVLKQLNQVERALQRLHEGNYGKCAHCGEKIPLQRLRVKPHATLCVNCKSANESK
jgi:DnaK suppressor protein